MKKKLLIAYGNSNTFHGSLTPLIPKLSETFDIFVMTLNYHLNDYFTEQLEHWKKDRTIIDYLVVPNYTSNSSEIQNNLKMHFFMRLKLNYLRKHKFDLFIGGSSFHIWERYLIDCILPHECIRVAIIPSFPWATQPFIVEGIMRGEPASDLIMSLVNPWSIKQNGKQNGTLELIVKDNLISRVYSKFIKSTSKSQFVKKGILFALNRFQGLLRHVICRSIYVMNRYIIPAFLVHKTFPPRKYDYPTFFDTNSFESIIVFQKFPSLFCSSLYKHAHVYLAQHPLVGTCRCCLALPEPNTLLVCLSSYEGTNKQQELLYRDLQIVMSECGAKEVHLKPHPRERGSQLEKLQIYLREKGIAATVMSVDKPVREIVCDYIGVVGCVSGSLFEARSACNYAFVVGFVAISQSNQIKNPKTYFCDIDNLEKRIDWIEEDGSYNPDIFKRRYHPAPPYPTITEILTEITETSKK